MSGEVEARRQADALMAAWRKLVPALERFKVWHDAQFEAWESEMRDDRGGSRP